MLGHIGREAHRGIAEAADRELDALERDFGGDLDAGELRVARGRLEEVPQADLVEPQQRGGIGARDVAHGNEAPDDRRLRALELRILGVVELHAGLGDERERPLGKQWHRNGHEAVRRGQREACRLRRAHQRRIGGAGILAIGIGGAVDTLVLVRGQALSHERDEHVVGREQPPVRRLVGRAPDVGRALGHFERIKKRLVGELRHERQAFAAIRVGFVQLRDARALAIERRGKRRRAQVVEVAEDEGEDARVLLLARGREVGLDVERPVVAGALPQEGIEPGDEALALEELDEASRAGIRDEVVDELVGLGREVRARRGHDEFQVELAHFLDGLDVRQAQRGLARQELRLAHERRQGAPRHRREHLARELLELVERGLAGERERHAVRAVVALVERAHGSGGGAGERVLVAGGELALAARGVVELARHADEPAEVVLHVAHRLVVHRVHLARGEVGIEFRRDEELREAVERAGERLVAHLEMVVGVVRGRVGVVAPAVRADEIAVLGDLRVFLGAEEEHVLEEVGEALALARIVDLAGHHGERGRRLVELRIGDQQHAHAIVEREAPENRGVGGCLDAWR